MRLVLGHDAIVAQWAQDKYAAGRHPPLAYALGIVDDAGNIRGAATFCELSITNVEMCYWGPRTISLKIARELARFCFDGLRVCRVTCKTPRYNKVVAKHLTKIGFRYEGLLRHYYGPEKRLDAIVFGMTRADAEPLLRNEHVC